MSVNTTERSVLSIPFLLAVAATAVLALGVAGCSGGSSGGGASALEVVGAIAEGLGLLPQTGVFLNNRIIVQFNTDLDPDSVSPQTFRVLRGPNFVETAPGEIGVAGDTITFIPQLPAEADFSDAGFQPATAYRIVARGLPDLNTIRSKRGKPLLSTRIFDLTTREESPFFIDLVAGQPRVIAVMIDLNGNGILEADGDPSTPDDEEFTEAEVDFGSPIPFVTDVPVGSVGLGSPNESLRVALVFNEPLNPLTVFQDAEDLNGDGLPDGDGVLDSFQLLDETNEFQCDVPFPGSFCPRPLLFDLSFDQGFVAERDAFLVVVDMELRYGLQGFSRHIVQAQDTLQDFAENELDEPFTAVFETGLRPPLDDAFLEDFTTTVGRDAGTTGFWNPFLFEFARAGIGFGGDGSDGPGVPMEGASLTLDTTSGSGVFNFTSFDTRGVVNFVVTVVGDKPAVIRSLGDIFLEAGDTINAGGANGVAGVSDGIAPRPGGDPGPGGGPGGGSSSEGGDTIAGDPGGAPEGTMGGGQGGLSGPGPGGGGGAGHASPGVDGSAGSDGNNGGDGGEPYGDPSFLRVFGGAGGGGGGNNTEGPPGSPGSSGGSGGGGGGGLLLETADRFTLRPNAEINAAGGDGGGGARPQGGLNSAGGGGGSGGTIIVRSREIAGLAGKIDGTGGRGGSGLSPAGRGGAGSNGRIRIERLEALPPACNPPRCDPPASTGSVPAEVLGKSVVRSKFLRTNAGDDEVVEYRFDGNFPLDPVLPGRVRPEGTDITVVDPDGNPVSGSSGIPENATIQVFFRGAFEDPMQPNEPDPTTITEWVTDVTDLNGFQMVQWEVRFDIGDEITRDPEEDPLKPGVDDFRLRFTVR